MSIVLVKSPTQNSAGPILSDSEFLLQAKGVGIADGSTAIFQVCQECKVGYFESDFPRKPHTTSKASEPEEISPSSRCRVARTKFSEDIF